MTENSKIQWTDHTFNPWWGCTKVSPGCDHCYAETFAKRVGHNVWGADASRRQMGDKYWREPLKWNAAAERAGVRARVFCASMADVFEGRPEDQANRLRLWALIRATPHLDWLLLTKRPGAIVGLLRSDALAIDNAPAFSDEANTATWLSLWVNDRHPPANVWLGTTVEDQARADDRIKRLTAAPAVVRFLSCEPLLERVDLARHIGCTCTVEAEDGAGNHATSCPAHGIDWVIVGGESGHGARPFHVSWARDIVEQCKAADVAVFVKQLGARPVGDDWGPKARQRKAIPFQSVVVLNDGKGGDMAEFPADLRIREFPRSST